MNKFKVGDRVAIYTPDGRYTGTVDHIEEGGVYAMIDGDVGAQRYHPKQCRKLKPKAKAREWWVAQQNAGPTITSFDVWDYDPRDEHWDESVHGKVYRVREVRRKK